MRRLFVTGCMLFALLLLGSSWAMAGWKEKVTRNQIKAREYIEQLMNGADPESVERPHIRYDEKYQVKRANREIRQAMDQAEEMAREGKHDQITMPEFKTFMSEERFYELQESNKGYRGTKQ